MVEINFLPWRVHLYEYKKKTTWYCAIAVLSCVLMLGLILYGWVTIKLHAKNTIILDLKKQLSPFYNRSVYTEHIDTQSALQIITAFENNQAKWIAFFQALLQLTPEDIIWQSMFVQDKQIIITGNTASFPLLLQFITRFDKNQPNAKIDIIKIKSLPHSDFIQFSLRFSNMVMSLPLLD